MPSTLTASDWRSFLITIGIGLLTAGTIYSFGTSGSLHFDDSATLAPLLKVTDGGSAFEYIFGGHTGPLGRPLALATFLIQKDSWPDNSAPFILANIAIHLFNGLLAAILCLELSRATVAKASCNAWTVALPAILWLLLPINATAVLVIVQRMTLLSALFTLAGLIAYVHGRRMAEVRPRTGLGLMTLGILVFTPLAAFSKENGALLPLYALTVELTLLSRLPRPREFRAWSAVFLKAPSLLVIGYLALQLSHVPESYQFRAFDFYDRITTQAYALFDYLRILALPRPLEISPFYDNYEILGLHAPAYVGPALIVIWTLILLWAISRRKSCSLAAFGVLWFLAGHVLESTTLPLELFFLHRNYLPSLGIAIAISFAIYSWRGASPSKHLIVALSGAVLVSFAASLLSTTTTWGLPRVAAELWVLERPSSIRATEYLSTYYRREGDGATADKLLRTAFSANRHHAGIAIDRLHTYCNDENRPIFEKVFLETLETLESGFISNQTTQKIDTIIGEIQRKTCPNLLSADVHRTLDVLEKNKRIRMSPLNRHNIHLMRFRLYLHDRLFSEAISSAFTAYEILPNASTARLIVETLVAGGLLEEAVEFVTTSPPPAAFGFRQRAWERNMSELLKELRADDRGTPDQSL